MHKRSRVVLLLTILGLSLSAPWAVAQTVTISAIVQHPDQYDGKVINAVGTIADYQERFPSAGQVYTMFLLEDGGSTLTVFVFGRPLGLRNGLRVRVIGTYSATKRIGKDTYRDQVGAQRVLVLR